MMLDLLCMCSDDFATVQHLDVMAGTTFVLFLILIGSVAYLQYVIFHATIDSKKTTYQFIHEHER